MVHLATSVDRYDFLICATKLDEIARMLQPQEFLSYQLQTPLGADELCSRYIAAAPDQSLVELRIFSDRFQAMDAWEPWKKRLRLSALVQHSAVQRVLAVEGERQPPFVVLELCRGPHLIEAQLRTRLTLAESQQLGQQLAFGVAEAHRLGIAVGNISPFTIVARSDRDWTVDITGMTGESSSAKFGAEFGTGLGTEPPPPPHHQSFIAPELLAGGAAERASDIFSLASVVVWLTSVTGKLAGVEAHGLRAFLESCLAQDPADRPTAKQFAVEMTPLNPLGETFGAVEGWATSASEQRISELLAQTQLPDPIVAYAREAEPAMPHQLGRFELKDKLGKGGMGTVYRACDLADGSVVAVKLLNAWLAGGTAALRRFAKEARLLAQANNPYLANLIEFNSDGGVPYLAVEFVPGGTVAGVLEQLGRFSEPIALALALDVARGLSVAHQRGIVHRDIKPDNLLLTSAGQKFVQPSTGPDTAIEPPAPVGPLVKLSDFGLARIDQQSESLAMTRDGAILGTPWYMSPEQCRGTVADARSDVYSLGATLFHLLTGRPVFEGSTPIAMINKHCHEPPPSLRQLRPELSEATARVVERCLAKNPDARYANGAELQADLEQILKGEPTSMRLHPATPEAGEGEVLEFRVSCELAASPAQLWPYVSNTDRINHALGLPAVTYTTRVDPQHGVERFAEMRILGQRLAWQEFPYEWIEGRRMSVLRAFSLGPFVWFVNVIELLPRVGGGTQLTQTFKCLPRNWLGRLLGHWQLGRKSPRAFRQAYQHIDAYLSQDARPNPADDAFGNAGSLSARQRSQLHQRLDRLRTQPIDPTILETLGQFLEHASDLEVARIRPLVFAERFQLDPQQLVAACLRGAREGLLVLLWDILCPSCRIAADVQETLEALQSHSYCPACDLKYEVDFANSVELVFRVHPELRTVETRTYCIGGPAFSAHVAAQTRLAPGERFALELNLGEGAYRIRGPQLPFAVELRVSSQGVLGRWELPLLRPPPSNSVPLLRTGSQVITLWNNTLRELQVLLERTAGRQMALTAAAASSLALFREMFPEQVLSPGQIVSVTNVTLLQVEICAAERLYEQLGDGPAFGPIRDQLSAIEESIRREGGAVVKIVGEGTFASFADPVAASRAALALLRLAAEGTLALRLAVHRGPALVTTLNDRLDYFGATPHVLRELLANAGPGEFLLTDEVASQPEVAQLLREPGLRIDIPPLPHSTIRSIVQRCRMHEVLPGI